MPEALIHGPPPRMTSVISTISSECLIVLTVTTLPGTEDDQGSHAAWRMTLYRRHWGSPITLSVASRSRYGGDGNAHSHPPVIATLEKVLVQRPSLHALLCSSGYPRLLGLYTFWTSFTSTCGPIGQHSRRVKSCRAFMSADCSSPLDARPEQRVAVSGDAEPLGSRHVLIVVGIAIVSAAAEPFDLPLPARWAMFLDAWRSKHVAHWSTTLRVGFPSRRRYGTWSLLADRSRHASASSSRADR